ncbi:acyl-CoA dehydrogenase family protein [Aneurinibacillus migulanus]|uniref:Acyl-CoA dehydrogenase n=1 Tax=Aneurinibacillus migulanus TaxID=47500 RepID=A0A0D1XU48_ANEMI|nr:acyl-CoA dehydrogenase family protein [Aneurinibacillus migulanus]KIV57741.1 acyl-CoA dehydrogenase [Aneurinibacillus migulanus]KON97164.1 acyl-CoA dehydrogenase [Aneurinibacillus migulanus]MED0896395.1 acyl-CoA dehydrogenase family protein [Aneurinibacillus migulanus]MED1616054.1 acyl-CoA dehydrogenase family protein [Aneurinibacillus migulanus]SDJ97257.1 Acyl-CoA dehydrogenase [Aneurinibacillus migulanus]
MSDIRLHRPGGSFLISATEADMICTPEDFTEEQRMIAATARQFIEREVDPYREEIENQDFDQVVALLRQAGELGLLAHSIPEAYGGLGLDKISKGLVGEIVGRTGGYGVAHSNHTCIATLPITYFGTKAQKEKYLPKLASGEYLGAYCLTEPSSGSDALSAKTTARLNEEGTHYILNGTKLYITNAVFSDTFIVYAKVDGDKFSAFIVERHFPGLSLGPEENKMGIKGSSTRPVIMEDCMVPVENLLGEVGRGHLIALNVLNLGRFNLGSACMGGAKYTMQLAVAYTNERRQFGTLIADFAASKEKVARMATRIYAAESLQYRSAGLLEDALGSLYDSQDFTLMAKRMAEYVLECAICKVYGSETLDQVVDEALQLHGGYGFIKEYKIEQMYRDSRINRIFEGTNEINRLLITNQFFKKAGAGQLPVKEAIKKGTADLQEVYPVDKGPLLRERKAIVSIRRILLALAGLIQQIVGPRLEAEQETAIRFADLVIHLYAAESAVLRAYKAVLHNGADQEALKVMLAASYIDDAVPEVEAIARKLVADIAEGTLRDDYLSLVCKELQRYVPQGSIARNRAIAERINQVQQYIC